MGNYWTRSNDSNFLDQPKENIDLNSQKWDQFNKIIVRVREAGKNIKREEIATLLGHNIKTEQPPFIEIKHNNQTETINILIQQPRDPVPAPPNSNHVETESPPNTNLRHADSSSQWE